MAGLGVEGHGLGYPVLSQDLAKVETEREFLWAALKLSNFKFWFEAPPKSV